MANFSDDFNRVGPDLGANWTNLGTANLQISGNRAVCSAAGVAYVSAASGTGRHFARAYIHSENWPQYWGYAVVKLDPAAQTYYFAGILPTDPHGYTIVIAKQVPGTFTRLAHYEDVPPTFADSWLELEYDNGTLTCTCQGVTITATDSSLAAGTRVGMRLDSAAQTFDDFSAELDAAQSMVVTPDPLWVGGGQQVLTATAVGTEWTPGEPGDTTFTCDHGTVDLQQVLTATTAEFLYTPAEYIGTLTFSESKYGLTATVNAVAVIPEGYTEAECRLTAAGAALINDTAVDTPLTYKLWRRDTPVGTTPIDYTLAETYKSLADYLINNGWLGNQKPAVDLSIVMRALNGGYEPAAGPYPEPTYRVLTDFLAALSTQIGDVQGPGGITLAVLAAALSDLRGVGSPSIKDVLDAVGNVNNDDVMTYLQALRGNDVVNLLQVVTALTNIQTLNGYDLGTIVQRLDDRPTTLNMNAAFAITNGAIGGLALEIAGLYKALGVVEATNIFDTIAGIVSDIFSGLGQEVVDQFIDSIFCPDTPLPQIVLTPPIWPGLSRANVGNAVALQNGQTIAGPLHGLLFTIDQQPTEKYAYHFGNVRSWGRVGAVIFATDRGDYERSQTFALDTQVLCPQQMAVADHAIIKVNSGWGGTVRPWTITQPQSP